MKKTKNIIIGIVVLLIIVVVVVSIVSIKNTKTETTTSGGTSETTGIISQIMNWFTGSNETENSTNGSDSEYYNWLNENYA